MMRWILSGFALWYGLSGLAMAAGPAVWWDMTPGVDTTGPFNGHFVRDAGFAFLSSGVGFALAALRPGWWPAAVTACVFIGAHALLHLAELATGHTHAPVAVEIGAVILPGLAAMAATALRMRETAAPKREAAHA